MVTPAATPAIGEPSTRLASARNAGLGSGGALLVPGATTLPAGAARVPSGNAVPSKPAVIEERTLRGFVRSLYIWVGIAVITACYFPVVATLSATAWLLGDKTWSVGHKVARFWARSVFKLNPAWSLTIDDSVLHQLAASRAGGGHFVVASNHASSGDIIVNLQLVHHFKFISKDSNFRVPFMGWFMYFAGYIPLKRGSKTSVARCMARSRWYLDHDVSVLFYPEGTRSRDGNLLPFKPGAFQLAIDAGVDVLPLVVVGTGLLLPAASFWYTRAKTPMKMIVGDPIPVAGLKPDDWQLLADRTREAMIAIKTQAEAALRHRTS